MIPIEKGVPLPKTRSKYRFAEMAVDDSIFVPDGTGRTISGSISYAGRCTGWKFTARTVEENGISGVRVWRVA